MEADRNAWRVVTKAEHSRTFLVRWCGMILLSTPSCIIPLDVVFFDLRLLSQVPVVGGPADQSLASATPAHAEHLLVGATRGGSLGNHDPSRFQVVGSSSGGLGSGK